LINPEDFDPDTMVDLIDNTNVSISDKKKEEWKVTTKKIFLPASNARVAFDPVLKVLYQRAFILYVEHIA
jgi:hypothetical protein